MDNAPVAYLVHYDMGYELYAYLGGKSYLIFLKYEMAKTDIEQDYRLLGKWWGLGDESSSHTFELGDVDWSTSIKNDGTMRFFDESRRNYDWEFLQTGKYYFEGDFLYVDYDLDTKGFIPLKH